MDLSTSFAGGLLGVLLFGCFIQVSTILSIIRYGLGLNGFEIGIVSFLLALVLSLLMVEAKFGVSGGLEKTVQGTAITFDQVLDSKIKPFLLGASEPAITEKITRLAHSLNPEADSSSLAQLEASFLLTQLKRALTIGLILLVPLVVIDLMVAVTLSVLGVESISASVIAIPLKLLLFISIDGWNLVVNKLLVGFV